jgi:hypothetical protein
LMQSPTKDSHHARRLVQRHHDVVLWLAELAGDSLSN